MNNGANRTTPLRNGRHREFKVTAFLAVCASLLTVGVQADLSIGDLYVDAATGNDLDDGRSWATAKASIQAAIDVASAGNLILVNDGRYEPIDSGNMRIEIRSVNGAETTVIDASLQWPFGITNRCATLGTGNSHTKTVLSGFCLTNGIAANGGGSCYGTLTNCVLSGNTATNYGGGSYYGSLNNCILSGNSAMRGGGSCYGTLNNCTLSGNTADNGGGSNGGTLNNCTLSGNTARYGGGSNSVRLNNCTLSGNTATYGGGSYSVYSTLNNCILWGNTARMSNAVYQSTCQYSCLDQQVSGIGNIFTAPLFVDAANGDFRLQPGSPCIDAGSNGYAAGNTDYAGNARIFGDAVDMGAYEFVFDPSTILLVFQDGAGTTASVTPIYGAPMPPITPPVRLEYNFVGYWTEPNGGGTQYYTAAGNSARNWDRNTPAMLYAQWTLKTCVVTLDAKGGSGGTASVTATYGTALPQITPPVREGLEFGGYWTEPNGGGTQYYTAAGSSTRNWTRFSSPEATLYAKWMVIGPSVTFRSPEISVDNGRSFIASSTTSGPTIEYGGHPEMDVFVELCNGACNICVDVETVPVDDAGNPVEGATTTTVLMDGDGNAGGSFRVGIPPLSAGRRGYRFVATGDVADAVLGTSPAVGYYVYETDAVLDSQREPDFAALLPHQSSQTCTQDTTYWHFGDVLVGPSLPNSVGFDSREGDSVLASLQWFDGIGRIYFKAHSQMLDGSSSTLPGLAVEMSHDGTRWETLNIIEVTQGATEADDTQFCIDVHDYSPNYVRFIPTTSDGFSTCFLYLRDVVITPPSANIELSVPSIIHPGYPSQHDDITFRVNVANVYDKYPAVAYRPVLHWRRYTSTEPGLWRETEMASVDGSLFECTLPAMAPERVEYYVETHFSGAAYDYTTSDKYVAGMPYKFYYAWDDTEVEGGDPKNGREGSSPKYLFAKEESSAEFSIEAQQRELKGPGEVEGDSLTPYLWFKVRPFSSHHRELRFLYTNAQEVVEVEEGEPVPPPTWHTNAFQLVGDETWLTTLPVNTNAHFFGHILGVAPYEGAATTNYGTRPTMWGDRDQMTVNTPFASVASEGTTTPIEAFLDTEEPVLMMARLDTTTGAYQIRRAAYQNFNDWTADPTYFEDSTGLYDTMTYEETFDTSAMFPLTPMDSRQMTFSSEDRGGEAVVFPGANSEIDTHYTSEGWRLRNGWILREREPDAVDADSQNIAAVLTPQYGYLENSSGLSALSEGLDAVSFRYRSSIGGNGHLPYYKEGFGWKNYVVRLDNARVIQMSPGHPYIQVIAGYADEDNYVAMRLTQMRELNNTRVHNWIKQEIIKVQNGVETVVPAKMAKNYVNPIGNVMSNRFDNLELDGGRWVLSLAVTNNAIDGRAYPAWVASGANRVTNVLYAAGALTGTASAEGGTISFDAFDSLAVFYGISVSAVGDATNSMTRAEMWNLGGTQKGGHDTRWDFWSYGVSNKMPPLPFSIGVCEAGASSSFPGEGTYETVYTGDAGSLDYATVTQPVHYWGNTFVRIAPGTSDARLVVDDVETKAWRGKDLPEEAPDDDRYWQGREAVVVTRSGSHQLALTTSRANPSMLQMVSTPEMLEGIGSISFNYEVEGGTVKFVVERNIISGSYGDDAGYTTVGDAIVAHNGAKGEVFRAIREEMTGKIRVRVIQDESDPDVTLYIDNLFVKGFPPDDGRSWTAYNALIVAPSRNAATDSLQFEEMVDTQTAFLNNDTGADTRPNNPLEDHMPYVQSPVIRSGVGEIGFWYRVWNPSLKGSDGETIPGRLMLWVSDSPRAEEYEWRQITVDDLAKPEEPAANAPDSEWESYNEKLAAYERQKAQFDNLACITNGTYQYFSAEICNKTNFVLRICSDTNGTQRVAIDNVIVTEPLFVVEADIPGPAVAVPEEWAQQFPQFEERFGSDFAAALLKETGKTDAEGNALLVWQDYVAGTDPTNLDDCFRATIRIENGEPVVEWSPKLSAAEEAKRKYTIFGKMTLSPDEDWSKVPEGRTGDYNFFRVTVEIR